MPFLVRMDYSAICKEAVEEHVLHKAKENAWYSMLPIVLTKNMALSTILCQVLQFLSKQAKM